MQGMERPQKQKARVSGALHGKGALFFFSWGHVPEEPFDGKYLGLSAPPREIFGLN